MRRVYRLCVIYIPICGICIYMHMYVYLYMVSVLCRLSEGQGRFIMDRYPKQRRALKRTMFRSL